MTDEKKPDPHEVERPIIDPEPPPDPPPRITPAEERVPRKKKTPGDDELDVVIISHEEGADEARDTCPTEPR